jgi:hypothetical protein
MAYPTEVVAHLGGFLHAAVPFEHDPPTPWGPRHHQGEPVHHEVPDRPRVGVECGAALVGVGTSRQMDATDMPQVELTQFELGILPFDPLLFRANSRTPMVEIMGSRHTSWRAEQGICGAKI